MTRDRPRRHIAQPVGLRAGGLGCVGGRNVAGRLPSEAREGSPYWRFPPPTDHDVTASWRSCVPLPRPTLVGASCRRGPRCQNRSEEHTSELQSLMRISYAVFCLKKKKNKK